jgi:hypothetical protein
MLWSSYPPNAAGLAEDLALAEELAQVKELAEGPNVTHVARGPRALAEPVQTHNARWNIAAVGEGRARRERIAPPYGPTSAGDRACAHSTVTRILKITR